MGSFNMFFDVGAPLGGFATGWLVDMSGYGAGFGTMAAVGAVGALLLIFRVTDNGLPFRRSPRSA